MVPMPVQPMDAVTRATPQGGVQFIGGTRAATLQDSFNRAAEVAQPAVVSINAIRNAAPPRPQQHPVGFLDPFDGNPDVMIGQQAYENVGAGVIVDPAGYVVTNRHVIEGASSVVVTRFSQQQEHLQARVVEIDNAADLALLQILGGAGNYPTASLADSSRIDVGDWVLAVGSPFGLEHTVTAGIVSGIRHSMTIGGIAYRNMVQTDAPINKGSSGGPLVNINGQVVGINTAIYAPTGVFNGTGFAIPSNQVGAFVSRVLEGLTGQGGWGFAPATPAPAAARPTRHENVYLGLGVIDMTAGLARRLAFPHAGGVFVSTIVMDSPADQAEISRGDIITAIDGFPIDDGQDFRAMLARLMPGQNIAVTIWRRGRTRHLHLTTATIPGAP
jgi:S1-C subfamily serine protease